MNYQRCPMRDVTDGWVLDAVEHGTKFGDAISQWVRVQKINVAAVAGAATRLQRQCAVRAVLLGGPERPFGTHCVSPFLLLATGGVGSCFKEPLYEGWMSPLRIDYLETRMRKLCDTQPKAWPALPDASYPVPLGGVDTVNSLQTVAESADGAFRVVWNDTGRLRVCATTPADASSLPLLTPALRNLPRSAEVYVDLLRRTVNATYPGQWCDHWLTNVDAVQRSLDGLHASKRLHSFSVLFFYWREAIVRDL